MKKLLSPLVPTSLIEAHKNRRSLSKWKKRGYLDNAPQQVKQAVFSKYGLANVQWIETGTYRGTTTAYLSAHFPHVHSIEPSERFYKEASQRFAGANVTLYNDISENVLPKLLPTLSGGLNLWLDGHYSAGATFKGEKECPVVEELAALDKNLDRLDAVSLLIDDVRCFLPSATGTGDYPALDSLVDWARARGFSWIIEHDIFIATKT